MIAAAEGGTPSRMPPASGSLYLVPMGSKPEGPRPKGSVHESPGSPQAKAPDTYFGTNLKVSNGNIERPNWLRHR